MKTFKHSKYEYKHGELNHKGGVCLYCHTNGGRCSTRPTTWIGARELGLWYCDEHLDWGMNHFPEDISNCLHIEYYEDIQ